MTSSDLSRSRLELCERARLAVDRSWRPVVEVRLASGAWVPALRGSGVVATLEGGRRARGARPGGREGVPAEGDGAAGSSRSTPRGLEFAAQTRFAHLEASFEVVGEFGAGGAAHAHLRVAHRGRFVRGARLEFARQDWSLVLGRPTYTWVPHLCPREGHVVGEHAFRSPAVVVLCGGFGFALVPDLDAYGDWPLVSRQFLEFLRASPGHPLGPGEHARLAYGYTPHAPHKHVFFRHARGSKFRVRRGTGFALAYHLLVFTGDPLRLEVLHAVNSFLWDAYASPRVRALRPQVLPFEGYVAKTFAVPFRHGAWREWECVSAGGAAVGEGDAGGGAKVKCGGFSYRSWLGRKKRPWRETPPWRRERLLAASRKEQKWLARVLNGPLGFVFNDLRWVKFLDRAGRTLFKLPRDVQVWNQAWFMEVRSAYGLYYFGSRLGEPEWVEKALSMVRALVHSPKPREGADLLPAVAVPWEGTAWWIEGVRAFLLDEYYSLPDVALGAYWLLKFHRDLGGAAKIPGLLPRVASVVDTILKLQEPAGNFPTYVRVTRDGFDVDDALRETASCAAVLALFVEFQKAHPDDGVLSSARRLGDFLAERVLPTDEWHDFESFYSCTRLPLDFKDERTGTHVHNTLCIYWAAEGFKGLFEATGDAKYLDAGLQALNVLCLYQQVWSPPFLSADLFGGFAAQNADAEWSDARQALFVRVLAEYYLLTRDPQWMERAVAALRASFALAMVPENSSVAPGNLRGLEDTTADGGVDCGAVAENYGHQGFDFRILGYLMFSWGIFSSGTAAAYVQEHFGDLFLDFRERRAFGINGVVVIDAEFREGSVSLEVEALPRTRPLLLKGVDAGPGGVELMVNGNRVGTFRPGQFAGGVEAWWT
ncbi:MAG: hypothetical protein ACTSU5_00015 [Promethearchaeota archaeon]